MFELKAKEAVTLRRHDGTYTDSKPNYTESSCRAIITGFTHREISLYGNIKNGKLFRLYGCSEDPEENGQLVHNGQTYDIKGVQPCKDLNQRIVCWRVAVG